MNDPTMYLSRGEPWFAVLPDTPRAAGVSRRLLPGASACVAHASGRPWLVGRWEPHRLLVARGATTVLAIIGCCPMSREELLAATTTIRRLGDVDALARRLTGSAHVIARVGEATRVHGTVSGLRRVYHASVDSVGIAADRAEVLAGLLDASVDDGRLALRLSAPDLPVQMARASLWNGVRAVSHHSYAAIEDERPPREVRWWWPPEPELSLADGADALRAALTDAVGARTARGMRITADMSGGLDSTSICYLAASAGRELLAFTTASDDPADDDPVWADRACEGLPWVDRLVVAPADMPVAFSDLLEAGPPGDEPFADIKDRADLADMARRLRAAGSQVHLTGDGGDEVLQGGHAYLHDLLRSRPLEALGHMHGYRSLRRSSMKALAGLVAPGRSYEAWILARAGALTDPPPEDQRAFDGWGPVFRLPPWATRGAAQLARDELARAAPTTPPLGATVGEHGALSSIVQAGHIVRRIDQFTAAAGLPLEAPFLDDRVVQACLRVPAHLRVTPWEYKPLLRQAMHGLVPERSLARTTKAGTSSSVYAGLRESRAKMLELVEGSVLVELGLVDAERLRTGCGGLWTSGYAPRWLSRTFGLERWLRDVRRARRSDARAEPHPPPEVHREALAG